MFDRYRVDIKRKIVKNLFIESGSWTVVEAACARILTPLVGRTQHHLRDSVDLVKKLQDKVIPPDNALVSFDLVSMFTNIPQTDAINIAEERLANDHSLHERTPIKAPDIVNLIQKDLELAYFQWNGEFFAQPKGLGMGKSTSSPLSDLFMEEFEQSALANYDTGNPNIPASDIILFWFRKADDTITAIHKNHIEPFFAHLNSIHRDIKWTKEEESEGKIAMLDVAITRDYEGRLTFDVYRKPTHTNQYIPFASHAPLSHKLATVRSLTRRAYLIPSTEENKNAENQRITKALAINGYPRWAYDLARHRANPVGTELPTSDINQAVPVAEQEQTPSASANPPKCKGFVSVPYYKGTTEPLTRIMRRAGLSAQVRNRGNLREQLVKSKDKLKNNHKT